MWNQCRAVVLQQLKRQVTRSSSIHINYASPALTWLQQYQYVSFSSISNAITETPTTFGGLTIEQILSRTTEETIAEVGTKQFPKVQHALSKYFNQLLHQTEIVPCQTMIELFTVGQLTRQPTMMLDTFRYMLRHYPHEIDYVMYGEVYRILAKQRAGKKLMAIYEIGYQQFTPSVPEVVYRFGITGQVELHDMDAAVAILEQMKSNGIEPTNENYSRIIQGYGRKGDHTNVMEWIQYVDPQYGQWHVSAVDRIILALGMVNEPEKAFDFYVQSNMELNGGTLITLLSVCRHNDCIQQASDILANRKRFDLKLDTRGYNSILETLEYLDRREDEILDILQEMTDKGISFDPKTKMIVSRNQDVLEGTYFDQVLALQRSRLPPKHLIEEREEEVAEAEGEDQDMETHPVFQKQRKRTAYSARPYLLRLLENRKLGQAVALADQFVRPFAIDDLPFDQRQEKEHLIQPTTFRVPSIIASEVIRTYIAARHDEKVDGLLHGFELLDQQVRVGHALLDIMVQYTNGKFHQNHSFAYRAAKVMQQQQVPIFRMQLALSLFKEFNDPEAALVLCHQAIDECTGTYNPSLERTMPSRKHHHEGPSLRHPGNRQSRAMEIDDIEQIQVEEDALGLAEMEKPKKSRSGLSWTQLTHVVNATVLILADHYRLDDALAILSKAIDGGLEVTPYVFVTLLSTMRSHTAYLSKPKGVVSLNPDRKQMDFYYTASAIEKVLDMMVNRYHVPITRAVLGNIALPLSGGDKHHRLRLLECFEMMEEAEVESNDSSIKQPFVLPTMVYSVLLNTARREEERELFERIYDDGMRVLKEETHHPSLGQRKQRGTIVLVPLDWEVLRITMLVETQALEEAYDVLMSMRENVGRLSYEAVIKVIRGLASATRRSEQTKGPLLTPERRQVLMNLVTLMEERQFQLTLSDTYEIVHLAKTAKLPELAIEVIRLYEKTYGHTTVEVLKQTSTSQTGRDKFAVKKMRTMYRTALKICEEEGQWKLALRLNDKVVEMLQAEIKEAKKGKRVRTNSSEENEPESSL